MRQHGTNAAGGWSNSDIIGAYRESISYDANGNILKYLRKGAAGNLHMDSLNYKYNRDGDGELTDNKLNHVRDSIPSGNYSVDIDDQAADNYVYDKIGNLKKDAAEHIDTIRWTLYGKINKIVKGGGSGIIDYGYDPGGNRTYKSVVTQSESVGSSEDLPATVKTFYIRDAQGNVLAVYSKKDAGPVNWNEQHLYGSSRLGMWNWDTIPPESAPVASHGAIYDSLLLGSRTYELTNHLGNVLSTISDKKVGHDSSSVVNYYVADVLSQNDYYPFGMVQPERQFTAATSYRYGFNGMEQDKNISRDNYDFGARIYDGRIGRWVSVDPLQKKYPNFSPYNFVANNPMIFKDPDGRDIVFFGDDGKEITALRIISDKIFRTFVFAGGSKGTLGIFSEWVEAPMPGVFSEFTDSKFQKNDYQIAASTKLFNLRIASADSPQDVVGATKADHVLSGEKPNDIDVNLVKSIAIQESGNGTNPLNNGIKDIMISNYSGDWDGNKEFKSSLGMTKDMEMSPSLSLYYALEMIYLRGFSSDGLNQKKWPEEQYYDLWDGGDDWLIAAERYNGHGVKTYKEMVQKRLSSVRPATASDYVPKPKEKPKAKEKKTETKKTG